MKNIPKKIFIQMGEETNIKDAVDFNDLVGISWSSHRIFKTDVIYTRPTKNKIDKKVKEFLESENKTNYATFERQNKMTVSFNERMLARMEYTIFGNANIQKKQFKEFLKRHPEFKNGLSCYDKKK